MPLTPKELELIKLDEEDLLEDLDLAVLEEFDEEIEADIKRQTTLSGHKYALPKQDQQDLQPLDDEEELPF